MTDLLELGAEVEWTDAQSAAAARSDATADAGRLNELVEWLSATQGRYPPRPPQRIRCLTVTADDGIDTAKAAGNAVSLAAEIDAGLRGVEADDTVAGSFERASAAVDEEIDSGADLVIVAGRVTSGVCATVTGLLTDTEPVAMLPRGADAVDTRAWVARAVVLRDERRQVSTLRADPGALLLALDSPALAAAVGLILQTVRRRTPVLLDGTLAAAAALVCSCAQARAGRWWRLADTSPDPVHVLATAELGQRPVLDLGTSLDDGTAGLLAAGLARTAAKELR